MDGKRYTVYGRLASFAVLCTFVAGCGTTSASFMPPSPSSSVTPAKMSSATAASPHASSARPSPVPSQTPPPSPNPTSSSPQPSAQNSPPASIDWTPVINQTAASEFAVEVSPRGAFFNYADEAPQWVGTGFAMTLATGQVVDVTAGHVVSYWSTRKVWYAPWPQIYTVMPGGSAVRRYRLFSASDRSLYIPDDVCEADPTTGGNPQTSLVLGNYQHLTPGESLLVIGNRHNSWAQDGQPVVSGATFFGLQTNVQENASPSGWPGGTVPDVLAFWTDAASGDSGAPVVDANGHVVGVFIMVGAAYGYAVPLNPQTGMPVGGAAVPNDPAVPQPF